MSENLFESFGKKQIEEYEDETGIAIPDIESIRFDQSPFEIRATPETREVAPGVLFSKGVIELPDDAFTNFYDLALEKDSSAFPQVHSAAHNFSLKRVLKNESKVIGAINAGFFYLVDEGAYSPVDPTYNLCIRQHFIVGLPSVDRPIVYTSEGTLEARDVRARGSITIGSNEYEWNGAHATRGIEEKENAIVLYNSACCMIQHVESDKTGTKRVLIDAMNFTPEDKDAFDLVVEADQEGILFVKDINPGGRTNLFAGNFILHVKGSDLANFQIGDRVDPLTLDGMKVSEIDSAVTIGPDVHSFLESQDHQINHDLSLGSRQPFGARRMARSVVYKDRENRTHVRVLDGAPKTEHFQGVTPEEVSMLLPQEEIEWAYHLDPGQSSRLALKESNSSIATFGNRHYMRFPKKENHPFLWSPSNGRRVPSAITFHKNDNG